MMKYKHLFLFVLLSACLPSAFAGKKEELFVSNATTDSVEILVLKGLNEMRKQQEVDEVEKQEAIQKTAEIQAKFMAEIGKAQLENVGKYKTTGKRLQANGGTTKAEEIVIAMAASKGKEKFDPGKIAHDILEKWKNGKKEKPVILNGNYVFIGVSCKLDKDEKKAYVSVVFGSYNSFNSGAAKRKQMKVPYTKKQKGLKAPANEKECKNCDKFKDYVELQKGLYVENKKVYLKYKDVKTLKKLLKKPTDGLAVDIIQRAQYDHDNYNIYDNNLVNKGVRLKTLKTDRLFSKNLIKDKKAKDLLVEMGKLPKGITEPYELNLLVIQDNKVCKTLMRSYLEEGDQESNTPLDMLLMPDSAAYLKPEFKPEAENTILSFVIPFEKNKSEFKEEDIKGFLNALNEPDFIVEGLYIYAYSSIEGDAHSNEQLQKKRAESIVKVMQGMQTGKKINATIKTDDSWNLFVMEAEGGEFDDLTKMKKEDAIKKINSTQGLSEKMETVLSKERFAKIVMDITYDISGAKEQKYSVINFNKAAKKGDTKQAYKIQYFIEKMIREKKYTPEARTQMTPDKNAANSGLLMNSVVYSYLANGNLVDEDMRKTLHELETVDAANKYIAFNSVFADIKLDENFPDQKLISATQSKIDGLYGSRIPKKFVDALNVEYQFKIIEAYDTLETGEAVVEACVNKIKAFYNFKEGSWQNALKVAYVFKRFKDYKFAAHILEPYINTEKVDEQLLFTYITLCAQMPEKIKSKMFVTAMQKANGINHDRYCQLFGDPKLTFQVMDNPFVKEDYRKNCGK